MKIAEMNFEQSMAALEQSKKIIDNPDTELEALLEAYENGAKYYQRCQQILQEAEQKLNKVTEALKGDN